MIIVTKIIIAGTLGLVVFVLFLTAVMADQDSSPVFDLSNDIWNA